MGQKKTFKAPAIFTPTLLQFKCDDCNSLLFFKISKPKKKDQKIGSDGQPQSAHVQVSARVLKPSQLLIDLAKEEAEQKEAMYGNEEKGESQTKAQGEEVRA
jgi:hypothetical protein